jgi:hypothetical protein
VIVSRLLVAAAVVLVVVAAADAVRKGGAGRATPVTAAPPAADPGGFALDRGAVELHGMPFLARGDLSRAFPGGARGRVAAERLARASDGTLVLGVRDDAGRSAVELWHDGVAVAAFRVPVGSYAGGLDLERPGGEVAAFGVDGARVLYDRGGRVVAAPG